MALPELSPERDITLTASDFPIAVNGDLKQQHDRVAEKLGLQPPPDLSNNLAVICGRTLEQPILDYMERTSGHAITERQRWMRHPTRRGIGCTLDGYRAHDDAVVEVKVLTVFREYRDIMDWYGPQLLCQMRCRGASRGVLAVLQDNSRLTEHELIVTAEYAAEVWARIGTFQHYLDTFTLPELPPPPQLIAPELWRTVDLATDQTNWGPTMIPTLRLWSDTKLTAEQHDMTKKVIKELLPDDVGTVLFGDITVKRDKRGAVTIRQKELKL